MTNPRIDQDTVERVARALCEARGENPDGSQVRFVDGGMHSATFLEIAIADVKTVLAAMPQPSANIGEDVVEALRLLNAHVEAMQRMSLRYLVPEAYEDREGVVWSDGDPEPFANDMIYMLDGPEQREAQSKARAALSQTEGQSRISDALSYGTLSMTKCVVVIDFDSRERAEAMFEALEEGRV